MSRPSRTRFCVLAMLVTLAALTYLDRLAISAAAPAIRREFGFSPVQMGYIFSAFTLAYAVFEIPSGWLSDRYGTRRTFLEESRRGQNSLPRTDEALNFIAEHGEF